MASGCRTLIFVMTQWVELALEQQVQGSVELRLSSQGYSFEVAR